MEGSVDQLPSRHNKYGLHNGQQEAVDEAPQQNGAAEGDTAEGRKHMSAHERRLQKKKVLLQMYPEHFIVFCYVGHAFFQALY